MKLRPSKDDKLEVRHYIAIMVAFSLCGALVQKTRAGDDCETVNLSDAGGSMEHIPVTQQGGEPDCYANAAAYMTSAYIQTHLKTRHRTSPDAIYADVLAGDKSVEDAESGRTCNAIGVVAEHGSCDQAALDRILKSAKDENEDWLDVLRIEYELGTGKYHRRGEKVPTDDVGRANGVCRNLEDDLNLPEQLTPGMDEIMAAVKKADPDSFYAAETEKVCDQAGGRVFAGKDFPAFPACGEFDFLPQLQNGRKVLQTPEAFAAKIHQLLSAGKKAMPIGIEYCSSVLFNDGNSITRRDFRPNINYLNTPEAVENLSPSCGFHASVVIGQKQMHGKCYFLVQNSWGKECEGLSKKARPCKNGRIWIPEDVLSRNLIRLSYF